MAHPSATQTGTQRRITLLRHAKAVPDEHNDDHARALTSRGRDEALALGEWLRENHTLPDLALCSTAERTRETLAALHAILPTELHRSLYLASAGEMLALLQGADDAVRHILLVGHNPGIHGLTVLLAKDYVRDADAEAIIHGYPTCGLVSMTAPIGRWKDLAPQTATVDALRFGDRGD